MQSASTLLRCHGRSRRGLCPWGSRRRNSKTMFGRPLRAPFHQPGLSLTVHPAYSSLHRLCGFQLLKCFVVYTVCPALSTAKGTENSFRLLKIIGGIHKGPEKPGEFLPGKQESDCKSPAKLLLCSDEISGVQRGGKTENGRAEAAAGPLAPGLPR